MFRDLRNDHGVRSYLAHDMTVTPANLDQIEDVVADVSAMGFSMLSFQPAAHVGDERCWLGGDYRTVGIDDVWQRIEAGLGQRVAWQPLQFGDPGCDRTAFGSGSVHAGCPCSTLTLRPICARETVPWPTSAASRSRSPGYGGWSSGPASSGDCGRPGVVETSRP